jgi:hypothetical protein
VTLTDAMMMAKPIEGLTFEIDQQGNTDDIGFAFEVTKSGGPAPTLTTVLRVDGEILNFGTQGTSFFVYMTLPGGNYRITFTIREDDFLGTYAKASNEIVVFVNGEFDKALFQTLTRGTSVRSPSRRPRSRMIQSGSRTWR